MPRVTRRLWLQIKGYTPGASKRVMISTLIRSIENGSYRYPKKWKVGLYWSNNPNAPLKSGEFTREMKASRRSSPGFDEAVINYLRGQR